MGKSKHKRRNKSVKENERTTEVEQQVGNRNEVVINLSLTQNDTAADTATDINVALNAVANDSPIEQPIITLSTQTESNGTITTSLATQQLSTDHVNYAEQSNDSTSNANLTQSTSASSVAAQPVTIAKPIVQPTQHNNTTPTTTNISNYFSSFVNTFGESSSRISTSLLNGITSITDTTKQIVTHTDDLDRKLSTVISKRIAPEQTPTQSPKINNKPPLSSSSAAKTPIQTVGPKLKPPQHRTMRIATITTQTVTKNGTKHNTNKQYIDTTAYIPHVLLQAEQAIQSRRSTLSNTPHSVPIHKLSLQSYSAPNTIDNKKQSNTETEFDTTTAQLQAHKLFTAK